MIFTSDSIKDILGNPRYVGRVPLRDGRVVAGTFPALVDVATFDNCERIRSAQRWRPARGPGAGKVGSPYLLSGLLRCATCDSTMSGQTHGADRSHDTRRTYTCYRRRVAGGCDAPMVSQDVVEADLLAVLRTMALPPGFARAVDKAVAARLRTYGGAQTASASALAERLKRVNEMYELGRISPAEYEQKYLEIEDQRARIAAPPAPLFAQQQQVLNTLVEEWDAMTADERKRMLAAIFDTVTAGADGVDRLEPCEDWRPYVVAAIPKPVTLPRAPTERKTGFEPATPSLARTCATAAPLPRGVRPTISGGAVLA